MSLITRQDLDGVKPLLQTGEFGYDNYPAGGDSGRVYVGTGSENIPLAKQAEMSAVDGKTDVHIARVDNPHGVTKAQVGLGNADNTADIDKIVASAGRLTEGKKINNAVFDNTQDITIKAETPNKVIVKFDGGTTEGTDTYTFDGSEAKSVDIVAGINVQLVKTPGSVTINVDDIETKWNEIQNVPSPTLTLSGDVSGSTVMTELGSATLEVTIQPNSVELGVDTIGNYVGDVTGVEGITVTGTKGENWTPEISITPVGIAGTYTKVTTNDKGQVINGDILSHTDIPDIDASKITSGVIDAARLPSYVDDVLEFSSFDDFPLVGETGKIYVAIDTNKTYRWSGTSYIYITSGAVDSVAGKTGVVILNKNDVGLNQVDNTSDVNKPISTATVNALALKADIESPVFTGEPKAPTAAVGDGTTQVATTAFVGAEIADKAYSKTQLDAGQLDNRYYTEAELLNGALDSRYYTETELLNGALDVRYYTETEIDTLYSTTVKLTGDQTVAGIKTFSSSPIVPTPTTDFQSVPLKSTNITVNVGAGQTYTTINQALEYLSGFYHMYKKSGVTATINLKAGFVMAEQVLVSGIDLGWITIVGEDAETIITHTALTTNFNGAHYPAFGVDKGGTSPVIGQLFRFNVEKVGGEKHGLMAFGAGSSAEVLSGKGFIGAGTYGILASAGSTINAYGANCSNAGGYGIFALNSSTINAYGANCSNAGSAGISAVTGSTINAQYANCSNAGTNGIYAETGSIINAYGAIIQYQTTGDFRVKVHAGATINAAGIDSTGGSVAVFNQAVNTLTNAGIIYR